jgi:hypothetical protein
MQKTFRSFLRLIAVNFQNISAQNCASTCMQEKFFAFRNIESPCRKIITKLPEQLGANCSVGYLQSPDNYQFVIFLKPAPGPQRMKMNRIFWMISEFCLSIWMKGLAVWKLHLGERFGEPILWKLITLVIYKKVRPCNPEEELIVFIIRTNWQPSLTWRNTWRHAQSFLLVKISNFVLNCRRFCSFSFFGLKCQLQFKYSCNLKIHSNKLLEDLFAGLNISLRMTV